MEKINRKMIMVGLLTFPELLMPLMRQRQTTIHAPSRQRARCHWISPISSNPDDSFSTALVKYCCAAENRNG